MPKRKTRTAKHLMLEGEWVRVVKRGHTNACCFCAAIHVFHYRTDENGGIEFRAKLIKPGKRL